MRSVKGMTIGSPEFDAVVKAAQREREVTELISEVAERVEHIMWRGGVVTDKQARDLHRVWRDIGEVVGV